MQDALRRVDELLKAGYTHVVDARPAGNCFDSIPHERLKQKLTRQIGDGRVLAALLNAWIEQDIVQDLKRWTPTSGTPQGAVHQSLLANWYLPDLDVRMGESWVWRWFAMRMTSSFCVERLLKPPRHWTSSHVGGQQRVTAAPDENAHRQLSVAWAGLRVSGLSLRSRAPLHPSQEPVKFKDRIRQALSAGQPKRGAHHQHPQPDVARLAGVFPTRLPRDFSPRLDGFIRRRLRALLRKQAKRPGHGHTAR
ncbi:MAG: hypothetical protein R3F18_08015 [Lysobacterales bacterium]